MTKAGIKKRPLATMAQRENAVHFQGEVGRSQGRRRV
jgi:hypothetical protein